MADKFKYGDTVTIIYEADLFTQATVIAHQGKGTYMLKTNNGIVFYHEEWLTKKGD